MKRIGVCIFDDVKLALQGWASISGNKAKRIQSSSELSSDVLWVTNLDYRQYRDLNFTALGHIFDSQYFRTKIKLIAEEIGENHNPFSMAEYISSIFQKVSDLGSSILKLDLTYPGYRYASLMSDKVLSTDFREMPRGKDSSAIRDAIFHSYQMNQSMSGKRAPKGSAISAFTFPRGAYARWLLSQPMPANLGWKKVLLNSENTIIGFENGNEISGTKAVVKKLKEWGKKYAVFLKIKVISQDSSHLGYETFSAGVDFTRNWAALPEILHLAKFSKINIVAGFRTPLKKIDLPEEIDLNDIEFSFSRGLFLENLWTGISVPLYNNSGSRNVHALAAYMRAYDRVACGTAASVLADNGYTIGSFGIGRVMVYSREGQNENISAVSLNAGLLPPMGFLQDSEDEVIE